MGAYSTAKLAAWIAGRVKTVESRIRWDALSMDIQYNGQKGLPPSEDEKRFNAWLKRKGCNPRTMSFTEMAEKLRKR